MDEKGKQLVNARFKLEHAKTTPFTHWEEVSLARIETTLGAHKIVVPSMASFS